jgi:hypothetical protein
VKYDFPADYGQNCILVPIDAALVPIVAGALLHFQLRGYWQTDDDYEQGYNAFAELQVAMSGCYLSDLIESQNRVYRLLDTALNGATYSSEVNPADPARPIVSPAIPAAPAASLPTDLPSAALRSRMERLINLVDNLTTGATPTFDLNDSEGLRQTIRGIQGEVDELWFGIGGRAATLADLIAALRRSIASQQQSVSDVMDNLPQLDAGDGAEMVDTVRGLFQTGEDVVADGGQLILTAAGAVGTVAMLGILAGHMQQQRYILNDIRTALQDTANGMLGGLASQIDRLIAGIDGGGDAPEDNVLVALRGTTGAGEMRNVIDSQMAAITDAMDPVELTLIDIKENTGWLVDIKNDTQRLTAIQDNSALLVEGMATISSDNALLLSMLTNVRDLLV